MSDENNLLQTVALDLEPGSVVSHTVVVVVTTRIDTFDEQVQVVTSPHTSRIVALGALTEALEMQKQPDYFYDVNEDED